MTTALVSNPSTDAPAKEHGFSALGPADWSEYIANRPAYPPSFFQRIYDYHGHKSGVTWSVAHDVGAGCGIISSVLANRFDNVIVSDPNDGYGTIARHLLVEKALLPESKFSFLQEAAEESSVESGTVDMITACECIHWTTPDIAIREFGRQLRAGGTLAITYYTRPLIEANEGASRAWGAIWGTLSKKNRGVLVDKAYNIANTALESLEFPEEGWETVKRIYINSQGTLDGFILDDRTSESKVKESEERIWVEDEDWCDMCDIEWFRAYYATWAPHIPKYEMRDSWEELERALEGKKVKVRTPNVMVLATRRA